MVDETAIVDGKSVGCIGDKVVSSLKVVGLLANSLVNSVVTSVVASLVTSLATSLVDELIIGRLVVNTGLAVTVVCFVSVCPPVEFV